MTLGIAELYRLRSDARRGLLENDLILQRFFDRYASSLSDEDGLVLRRFLAIDDNDLMDLLIGRKESIEALKEELNSPAFKKVLTMLRER